MEQQRIPLLNQKFEVRTLIVVFKKMFWLILLILLLATISGVIFYRYTKPVFEADAVIQIKAESKTGMILGLRPRLLEQELAPAIEIIKSNEFLKTCIDVLPLDIVYFNKGTFLSTELYKTSPFQIEYVINNSYLYNQEIFIDFVKEGLCIITYRIGNQHFRYNVAINEWHSLSGIDILVTVEDKRINELLYDSNDKEFYFTVYDERAILNNIKDNLIIHTLSESAGTIAIKYQDHNARKAADITNTVAEMFINFEAEQKQIGANNVVKFIDEQIELVTDKLNESERDLYNFRQANQLGYQDEYILTNRSNFIRNQINNIESSIFKLELELMTLDKVIEMMEEGAETVNIYELLALLSGQQSERFIGSMLNNILRLEQEKENLLFDVTPSNHRVRVIDSKIESQKSLIIDFVRATSVRLEKQKESIASRLKEYEGRLFSDSVYYDEIEYAKLLRVHSINEDFYAKLIQTRAETMITQAGYVSDNLILQRASESKSPVYPDLKGSIFGALIIALVLSLVILLVKYLFYNRIHSTYDISQFTDISIIGGVPLAKKNMIISEVLVVDRPKSMMAESFRNIRTNLEFFEKKDKLGGRVITVSSTIAGEGKTFVAINTAAISAMAGKKSIILDLDLRRPRIHKSFKANNNNGLSNVLIGKANYKDCIQHSTLEGLDFIPSGPLPPNPAEIVLSRKYEQIINLLKKEYDVIVLDTPPIGIVTDALPSYLLADNPIYVMRAGISPKAFIDNVKAFKEVNKIQNLGIVLNGVERSNVRAGYGYKTGYGYQYGYGGYGYGYGYLAKIYNNYYGEDVDEREGFFKNLKNLITGNKTSFGIKNYIEYLESERDEGGSIKKRSIIKAFFREVFGTKNQHTQNNDD